MADTYQVEELWPVVLLASRKQRRSRLFLMRRPS